MLGTHVRLGRSAAPSIAAVLFLTIAGAAAMPAEGAGVIFRYLPGRPEVSSEIVSDGVEAGPFLDPRELTARGPGGWGYEPPYAAEFDASSSTLRGALTDDISQPFGPALTAEVWIRPLDVDGTIVLLSNRVGGDEGVVLGLEGRRPYFSFFHEGAEYRIDSQHEIEVAENYWIAATTAYSGGTLTLSLYLNGALVVRDWWEASISSPYTIDMPVLVGTTGSGDSSDIDLSGSYTGLLYAAVVRRYVAADSYLNTPAPKDGSTYMGLPSFLDVPVDDPALEMDQQIDSSPIVTHSRLFLPHVNDGFIPQGTATSETIEGTDTTRLVYVSYYHRTPTSGLGSQNSIVVEIDAESGTVCRTFRLTGRLETSHAGGIAFADGAIYVSSAGYLERYPVPAFEPGQRYLDLEPDESGTVSVASKASFVSAFRDTLWVGDWRTASEDAPYLYGYPLGNDGRPETDDPVVYALPRYIQGVDFFDMNGEVFGFMSRNRNSTEAELLRYRPWQLDRYAVDDPDSVITMPYGIEDLSFSNDGSLWTNSESGTDFYQNGSPSWSIFFPFVYSVPVESIFPENTYTGREDRYPRNEADISVFPNPMHSTASIWLEGWQGTAKAEIYDSLGRRIQEIYRGPAYRSRAVDLISDGLAAGVYFLVVQTANQRMVRSIHVIR